MDTENIKSQLEQEALQNIPGLSQSDAAEWKLWTSIMALAVKAVKYIASVFTADIDKKLAFLRPGTTGWYARVAREFQYGHSLIVKDDGSLGYAVADPEAMIVAAVSVVERSGGGIVIKVARDDNGELAGLNSLELEAFENYMESVKFVGTKLSVISQNADTVKYNLKVFYSPAFDPQSVELEVKQALESYKLSLDFSAVIYSQRFIQAVINVPGVVTAELISFEAKQATGIGYQPIEVRHELYSGYFNYDNESVLVLEPSKNIPVSA